MLNTATAEPAAVPVPELPAPSCENCRTPLLGPHCHACGQPVKGLVRHFSSFFGDLLDTVFNLDARLPRTLIPLFARPGHLTREYLAGRRVRYVNIEHLIVALHSHAFVCLTLLLQYTQTGLFAWIPAYLLLMQKRVYAQGWGMTLLKFGLVGIAYLMLLTFGAVATVLASLVWL